MRAVIQRVVSASVDVEGKTMAGIDKGAVVLLGIENDDGEADIAYMADKISALRYFPDDRGKLNLDLDTAGGSLLLVSQFTLLGDCRKGRRPDFFSAAGGDTAKTLFDQLAGMIRKTGIEVKTGVFGANMLLHINNDGPVTLLLDSRKRF